MQLVRENIERKRERERETLNVGQVAYFLNSHKLFSYNIVKFQSDFILKLLHAYIYVQLQLCLSLYLIELNHIQYYKYIYVYVCIL